MNLSAQDGIDPSMEGEFRRFVEDGGSDLGGSRCFRRSLRRGRGRMAAMARRPAVAGNEVVERSRVHMPIV